MFLSLPIELIELIILNVDDKIYLTMINKQINELCKTIKIPENYNDSLYLKQHYQGEMINHLDNKMTNITNLNCLNFINHVLYKNYDNKIVNNKSLYSQLFYKYCDIEYTKHFKLLLFKGLSNFADIFKYIYKNRLLKSLTVFSLYYETFIHWKTWTVSHLHDEEIIQDINMFVDCGICTWIEIYRCKYNFSNHVKSYIDIKIKEIIND